MSLAAYLRALKLEFRIFGSPMQTWLSHMPQGMLLKSEGFASTLYDPEAAFTLAGYCRQEGLPYADVGLPVPLETFTSYGLAFQKHMVPELEDKSVVSLDRSDNGFQIALSTGEVVRSRRVIAAIGISHFQYLPPVLSSLPKELVTHSSEHHTFERFEGKKVAVVGAGASAADVAAALLDAGAEVEIVARRPIFLFHEPPGKIPRPLTDRVRAPMTGLGPGWKSWLCTEAPLVFRQMPQQFRLRVVRKHLGPAAGYAVKDRVVGHLPFHLGLNITAAERKTCQVRLQLCGIEGSRELLADHVIAATGYRTDLRRVPFFSADTLAQIRTEEHAPALSSNFESSVPGLYFVGAASANTFGPLTRFAFGAGFTTRRLAKHLAKAGSSRN